MQKIISGNVADRRRIRRQRRIREEKSLNPSTVPCVRGCPQGWRIPLAAWALWILPRECVGKTICRRCVSNRQTFLRRLDVVGYRAFHGLSESAFCSHWTPSAHRSMSQWRALDGEQSFVGKTHRFRCCGEDLRSSTRTRRKKSWKRGWKTTCWMPVRTSESVR
jgi:hypothetical protein